MNMNLKYLIAYLALIFGVLIISAFLSPLAASIYLSIIIIVIGLLAIVWQKFLHKEPVIDLGFKISRNVAIGLGIGIVYISFFLFVNWIFGLFKIVEYEFNMTYQAQFQENNLFLFVLVSLLIETAIMFIPALFGEELAWRGYILSKLDTKYGKIKVIGINSLLFAVWHLPVYFSLYIGGALDKGVGFLILSLFWHGISVISINILFLTTKELYSVSFVHAISDAFAYVIFGNPNLGYASQDALYHVIILNEVLYNIFTLVFHLFSIGIMIGIYLLVQRYKLVRY
ncbi:MAG: membrane protein of unknown function [Promethearchaeota archaeon]|nr:MAG: membrane protein of unknown function [Candidatus Lokiarchaeota archaeon]